MAIIYIKDKDGNNQQVSVPDWALEGTQKQLLELTKGLLKDNTKTLGHYKKIIANAEKTAKAQEKSDEERNKLLEDSIKQQQKLADDTKKRDATKKTGDLFGKKGAIGFGKGLLKFAAGLVGTAALLTGVFGRSMITLGQQISGLTEVGVGFDEFGKSTTDTIADLNRLGLSTAEAASAMVSASGAIQVLGKKSFVDLNKHFAEFTAYGSEFGLVMSEAVSIMTEDLELRQRTGILDQIDSRTQAKNSADLYRRQLQMTTILGKSISDIRSRGDEFIADSAQVQLSVMRVAANSTDDMANKLMNSVRIASSGLTAIGVDANIANQMLTDMFDPVAFMSEGGQQLFTVFSQMGKQGRDLSNHIHRINVLYNRGNVEEGMRMMEETPELMMKAALAMNGKDFQQFRLMLGNLGPAGDAMAKTFGDIRLAASKYGDDNQETFSALMQGAAMFENQVGRIRGAVSSSITTITGAFGPALHGLLSQFEGDDGILSHIIKGSESLSRSIQAKVEKLGGFDKLGVLLNKKLVPVIESVFNWLTRFVNEFSLEETIESIKSFYAETKTVVKEIGDFAVSIRDATRRITGFFTTADEKKVAGIVVERNGEKMPLTAAEREKIENRNQREYSTPYDISEHGVRKEGEALPEAQQKFSSARLWTILGAAAGVAVIAKIAKLVIGGMIIGKAAGAAAGAAAGGAGAAGAAAGIGMMAKAGLAIKAIGATIMAITPAIAVVTLAVIGIGAGLRLAAPGLEALGNAIKNTLEGVSLVIGEVLGGIGDIVTKVAGAITEFKLASAEAEAIKLDAQANAIERLSGIPSENILNTASAIKILSGSMAVFGDVVGRKRLGFDTGLDIDKQLKHISVFDAFANLDSVKIASASNSITMMANAYEKFAKLDNNMLIKNTDAIAKINQNLAPTMGESILAKAKGLLGGFGENEVNAPAPTLVQQKTPEEKMKSMTPVTDTKKLEDAMNNIARLHTETNKLLKTLNGSVQDIA